VLQLGARTAPAHGRHSKQWRKDHPFGFYARPVKGASGGLDLKKWECGIPGKEKTKWAGGLFKVDLLFPDGQSSSARRNRTTFVQQSTRANLRSQSIPRSHPSVCNTT
jgi:hypothetical protein